MECLQGHKQPIYFIYKLQRKPQPITLEYVRAANMSTKKCPLISSVLGTGSSETHVIQNPQSSVICFVFAKSYPENP